MLQGIMVLLDNQSLKFYGDHNLIFISADQLMILKVAQLEVSFWGALLYVSHPLHLFLLLYNNGYSDRKENVSTVKE